MIVGHEIVEAVPLSRSRFLAKVGTAMVMAAAAGWFPRQAQACYIPSPCTTWCQCNCCNGSTCCEWCCLGGNYGCASGGQCWYTCAYDGSTLYKFRCCDWGSNCGFTRCICRANVGPCN